MTRCRAERGFAVALLLIGAVASAQTPAPDSEPAPAPVTPLEPAPSAAVPAPAVAVAVTPEPPPQPAAAPERPARIQLSEALLASYHLDNGNIAPKGSPAYDPTGNNYVDWLNKLQLDASWGDFTAALRVDSALFGNTPVALASDVKLTQLLKNRYGSRVDFEKVFLTWSSRYLDVTLGDTYATYGRGLVLALRKVDEFGIDTTVRGLNATAHVGGFTINALGGWSNIVNVDPATGRTAPDPNDVILGARAEYRFGKWFTPGFDVSHVIYAQNSVSTGTNASHDTVTSLSGTLEFPHLGKFGNLYAELAGQRRVTSGTELWTTAFYASGSAYVGRLTLLLEFKDYRDYSPIPTSLDPSAAPEFWLSDFYTAAPTLERVQQLVLNNSNIAGAHVRASYKVNPNAVLFFSMAGFVDRSYQTEIYDPYAGAELRWNDGASRASFSGGYRRNQYAAGSVDPGNPFQTSWHVELDVNQHLTGPYSVELNALHLAHRDRSGPTYLPYHFEGQAYLSFKRAEDWSVALGYEYFTSQPDTIRSNYLNVGGSWHPLKNLLVRGLIGGQRAGIKCVNGVCRNYPGFDGARLEVVAKY